MKTSEIKDKKKVIVLTGTTCTGKSSLALNISDLIPIEIISADSMLVYKGFDIGTAKPQKDILKKKKHHLINIINPDDEFDAWKFMEMGRKIIDSSESIHFLVVGGTQLYIKSLIDGLSLDISRNDDVRRSIQEELNTNGLDYIYDKLRSIDPDAALRISPKDKQRIMRYLEINYVSGKNISKLFIPKSSEKIKNVEYLKVGIQFDKDDVNKLIEKRVDEMISRGFIEEVKELRSKYSKNLKPFRSIGYKEVSEYLDSDMELDSAIELIKIRTKQFAKRQRTWLKKDSEIKWFEESEDLIAYCINYISS